MELEKFNALPDNAQRLAKEAVARRLREDESCLEPVLDDLVLDAQALSIHISPDDIAYSVGFCQSDYVCLTGGDFEHIPRSQHVLSKHQLPERLQALQRDVWELQRRWFHQLRAEFSTIRYYGGQGLVNVRRERRQYGYVVDDDAWRAEDPLLEIVRGFCTYALYKLHDAVLFQSSDENIMYHIEHHVEDVSYDEDSETVEIQW